MEKKCFLSTYHPSLVMSWWLLISYSLWPSALLEHLQQCSVYDPAKNIFHIQVLVMYSFATPTHKTETGIANRWGMTTNSKPPGPIIMMGGSETLSRS